MADRIDNKDQRVLAQDVADLLARAGDRTNQLALLIDDDKKRECVENVLFDESPLIVKKDERAKLSAAGFSDEFIDELAGKDGMNVMHKRIRWIAPLAVPSTIWLFRKPNEDYLRLMNELKRYWLCADEAVPYLLRALDDEDLEIQYVALETLTAIGVPPEAFEQIADICGSVVPDGITVAGGTMISRESCEVRMLEMFGKGVKPERVFDVTEYYFNRGGGFYNRAKFATKLAQYKERVVPFALKLLDSGKELLALDILIRINYRSDGLRSRLVEMYNKNYSDRDYELTIKIKTYIARLMAINGEERFLREMAGLLVDSMIAKCNEARPPLRNNVVKLEKELIPLLGLGAFEKLVEKIQGLEVSTEAEELILDKVAEAVAGYSAQILSRLLELSNDDDRKVALFALRCMVYAEGDISSAYDAVMAILTDIKKESDVRGEALYVLNLIAADKPDIDFTEVIAPFLGDNDLGLVERAIFILHTKLISVDKGLAVLRRPWAEIPLARAHIFLPLLDRILKEGKVSADKLKMAVELRDKIESGEL